jgi:hypothetical protein
LISKDSEENKEIFEDSEKNIKSSSIEIRSETQELQVPLTFIDPKKPVKDPGMLSNSIFYDNSLFYSEKEKN